MHHAQAISFLNKCGKEKQQKKSIKGNLLQSKRKDDKYVLSHLGAIHKLC